MENLTYSEIVQKNSALKDSMKEPVYKISVLSNVVVHSIKEILEYSLRIHQINPCIEFGNYDNIIQDSLKYKESALVIVFFDMLNIVDGFSHFFEDSSEDMYNSFKNKIFAEIDTVFENLKDCPSVIFNTFSYHCFVSSCSQPSLLERLVRELNSYLEEKKRLNVSFVDIDKIFLQTGIKQALDFRMYNSSKAPYTLLFFKKYAMDIQPIFLKNTGKLKKALIFDCDNTLWKGVVGEDGIDKIDMSRVSPLGRFFAKVQDIAVYLSKKGIIVGLCSKNNASDVMEVLKNHSDMILKEEYISIKKINWDDKAKNLLAIASELNIGLDSMVFVDDSSFEIHLIQERIPEILSLQVPSALHEYPDFLLQNVYRYFSLKTNKEDAQKTEIYKQQSEREKAKQNYKSLEEYLASLKISLSISKDDLRQLERIAQLTQKTNQFNLTTKRYTETQILNMMNNEQEHIFSVCVKDRFGDNGLTAISIIKTDAQNPKIGNIDTFLMSCRIIGRNIEFVLMDYLVQWLASHDIATVTAEYIPTPRNQQVQDFYESNGFIVIKNQEGNKSYSLEISRYQPKNISYIAIENS